MKTFKRLDDSLQRLDATVESVCTDKVQKVLKLTHRNGKHTNYAEQYVASELSSGIEEK